MGEVAEAKPETATAVFRLLAGGSPQPLPRHRHAMSRDDIREAQRVRITAAAIELFAADGYAATSALTIAKRAGVSSKTFYQLYPSKEDLFLDAYQAVGVVIRESGLNLPDGGALRIEAGEIADYAARILAVIGAAPAAARVFFLEAVGAGRRVRVRRNEAIGEFVDAVAPAMCDLRSRTDPALPSLTEEMCHLVVAAGTELIIEYLAEHDPATLPDLAPRIAELVRLVVIPNYRPDEKS
jgi:AcrR family transcriptional regulator